MSRRRSSALAAILAGFALISCGHHDDPPPPTDTSLPQREAGADATIDVHLIDADAAEAAREAAQERDAGADQESGPIVTGLWIADPTPVLAEPSPSCLDCGMANCSKYISACATIAGSATDGPAKGTSKSELCVETLGCVLSSGCASCDSSAAGCYPITRLGQCYYRQGVICAVPTPDDPGPCLDVLQRSLESTSCPAIVASFSDPSKGGGWALLLTQCLIDNHCSSCFPVADAGDEAGDDADDETVSPP